jgi:hypothetical protein
MRLVSYGQTAHGPSKLQLRFEPSSYLEIIPWAELTHANPGDIFEDSGIIDGISNGGIVPRFCLWDPSPTAPVDRHFVSDEETLQYRISGNLCSLGHSKDGKIVFILTRLCDSSFASDFNYYWNVWVR